MNDYKVVRRFMKAFLFILSLVIATRAFGAVPIHKGGVPTLNTNTKKQNAYEAYRKAAAANAAYHNSSSNSSISAPVVPITFSSTLMRRSSSTSSLANGSSHTTFGSTGGSYAVFTYKSSEKVCRSVGASSSFSGGDSAGGLMDTGSRYSSSVGSTSAQTLNIHSDTSGPRKKPGDNPGEPFLDPIGDAVWPLMILALAFAFGKWIAKRTKPLR
ncbi:MAG: hypothetical protein IKX20_01515 [Paludibacteraceae bacterium]|nr:hypothetical protein [Paludibacteraceae bacterium]